MTTMKTMKTILLPLATTLLFATTSAAQARTADQCRQNITDTTRQVLEERGRPVVVTSGHRDDSAAHRRGAIDIRSNDVDSPTRHADARAISERLPNHNVIVEERDGNRQTNTTYRNGVRGATREGPARASATHTHIQPDARDCQPAGRGARRAD